MAPPFLSYHVVPAYLGAIASIGLVFVLMRHAKGRSLHRILALYLIAFAGTGLSLSLGQVAISADAARHAAIGWQLWGATTRGMLWVLAFSFAPLLRWRAAAWAVAAFMVGTPLALWAVRGTNYMQIHSPGTSPNLVTLGNWQVDILTPPLLPAIFLIWLSAAVAPVLLAIAYRRADDPRSRRSLGVLVGLVSAGAAFWMFRSFLLIATDRYTGDRGLALFVSMGQFVSEAVIGLLSLAAVIWLMRTEVPRRRLVSLVVVLGTIAALAASVSVYDYRGPLAAMVDGFRLLAVPLVMSYAILRNSLFDLDLKARFTVKGSTLAAIFIAVIFIVGEGAQVVFGDESQWIGILAGGALVFALAPLQRFADRVASAAVPSAKPLVQMDSDEKAAAYEEVLMMAWIDGSVDAKERKALDEARQRLGLSIERAHAIEAGLLG